MPVEEIVFRTFLLFPFHIRSVPVIRKLQEKISDRLYSMEYVETFKTYPEPVEA